MTAQKRTFRDKGVLLQKSSEMITWFAKHMSCGSRQGAASPLLKLNKSPPANFSTGTKWVWYPKTGSERVIWNHHQIIPNHKTCRADHPTVRWADKKEFFGQTERLWMRENEKDDYGGHGGRGKDYWLDSGFSEHLYANDFSRPSSGNTWRHLTLRGQPRLSPIFRLRNSARPEHVHLDVPLVTPYSAGLRVNPTPPSLSLIPALGCQPASHEGSTPRLRPMTDSFPRAITWAPPAWNHASYSSCFLGQQMCQPSPTQERRHVGMTWSRCSLDDLF